MKPHALSDHAVQMWRVNVLIDRLRALPRSVLRTCESLVLKLSKSGSGIWAPFPLSMDQNMEGWTKFLPQ